MRSKSPNSKEKDTTGTKAEKNDLFPEMTDENWKPSFMEVVRSKSWTEHLTAYFITFGVLLYLILSPEGEVLAGPRGYNLSIPGFIAFLDSWQK